MASIFGHAYSALAINAGYKSKLDSSRYLYLGMLCAIIPDADVISFKLGISYEDFWGHRGFTHSIAFAILMAFLISLFSNNKNRPQNKMLFIFSYFFLCTVSHCMLDALTNGGRGVAFFSPFANGRYFFPWRPIQVSPLGAENFFSEWGLEVIKSEIVWIGIPGTLWILISKYLYKQTDK